MDRHAALAALFMLIDANGNGKLEMSELRAVFGEHASEFLRFCNAESNGELTTEEFVSGIMADCSSMKDGYFQTNWLDRMTACITAAKLGKRCVFVGLGPMGRALVEVLVRAGYTVSGYNRSSAPAQELHAKLGNAMVINSSLQEALESDVFKDAVVVCCLSSHSVTKTVLSSVSSELLHGRTLLNLCSGSPDEVREFHQWVSPLLKETGRFVSGAFAGSPSIALAGKGVVMMSVAECHQEASASTLQDVERLADTLGRKVSCGGKLGCERALDYAVVDLYLANLLSVTNGLAMLDQEGVPAETFLDLMDARLPILPQAMREVVTKMQAKDYNDVSAAVSTWTSFLTGRLGYLENHGIPTSFPDYALGLLQHPQVSGGDGEFASQDVSRVQEALRRNQPAESMTKRARTG